MRKPDTALKSTLLTAAVVLLAGSTWAIKSWQQLTATAINGTAFYDCNSNGVRDNNESPFVGIPVSLNGRTTLGDSVNLSTTTDNTGNYGFVGVLAGTYSVKFNVPNGTTALSFTAKSTATNGSDANTDGSTDPLSIDGLTDVQGIDVGLIDRVAPVVRFVNPALTTYRSGDTLTVECDNLPTMNASWATATDNSGQVVNVQFLDFAISTNNCRTNGYITILNCIFRATDACGNVGEINIFVKIKDSTPPVLRGVPSDLTVNTTLGEQIPTVATGITATDNCTQNLPAIGFQATESLNTCGKIITRTWTSTDDCGNISRRSQRIMVISDATCGTSGFPSDTIRLVLSRNTVLDTCLSLPSGSVFSNIQHCGSGQAGAAINLTASNCLRINPSVNFVGLDTFCLRICDVNGQNCRDVKLILNVQAARFTACNILGGRDNINLMTSVCGQNACYCIVGTTDIRTLTNDYTVTDNGRPYDGGYSGCQFDTIFSYNYFTVPEMGTRGPYRLDSWQVNGTTRQIASFQTMQTLADSMNLWDPMGNWRIDAARFLIYGGDMRSQYGQMRITRLSNLSFGVLELNTGLISNGVKLCFSTGNHEIIFQNNVTGCADTLRANVFCENDRREPIAINDRISTPKNTSVRVSVLANDTLNGVFQSLVATNQPLHGLVGFHNAQTFLYTPNTDFCGKDSFDYRICNAFGLCSTARVFVDVTCNDTMGNNGRRPVAVDDVARTRMNTAVTLSVLANDTLNGTLTRPLSITRFQTHGSVNILGNQVIYTPMSGFCNGLDSFDYEICNANGCDTGKVIVTITCEGDTMSGDMRKPVALDDVANTRLNTPVTISVLANDSLNGALTGAIRLVRQQMHGTVSITNNQVTFIPMAGFCNGLDSFDYEICNRNGCDTGRVVVNITCSGDTMMNGMRKPVAVDDAATTRLNTAIVIPVLLNDTLNSPLTGPLSVTRFQMHGTVNIAGGLVTYTPMLGFCGNRDTFDYAICNANGCDTAQVIVTVTCENDGSGRPVAVDDQAITRLDSRVMIPILANDILNGSLTGAIDVIRNPRHGIALIANNQLSFLPDALFCGGFDTLDYKICNALGCDTASVIIEITCASDSTGGNALRKPVAVDDQVSTRLNTSFTIAPLANDSLFGVLSRPLSIISPARHGMVFVMGSQIMYMPETGFCGSNDTLDYEICNRNGCDTGQIVIAVSCDNGRLKPVAVDDIATTRANTLVTVNVLTNDALNGTLTGPLSIVSPQRHGTANVVNNQIIYTPSAGYCGANDTLDYEICNANGCDTGRLVITINCDTAVVDTRKPKAQNDFATTQLGRPVTITVLANDSIFGTLSRPVTVIRSPSRGTASVLNNQIVYSPNPNFCGSQDSLTYEICNINGCDSAKIYITITCDTINGGGSSRPVVAVNDNITTRKNTAITFVPTINDTIRTRLLSLMITGLPRNGAVAFRGLDTLLYTPNLDFCGRDTIGYTICDTSFNCSNAFVYINVNCDTAVINRNKPVAQNDFATTQKGRPVTISVLTNDSTYGALIRPVTIIRAPSRGLASVINNQITYAPDATFCGGQDSITYEICNVNGCDTAKLYIAVTCDTTINSGRQIVAVDDTISTRKNTQIRFNPTVNDTIRTRLLALMIINSPRNGTVSFVGLDTLIYVPNAGFCGRDTFEYSICDTSFNCDNAFIFINVSCDSVNLNMPPVAVPDYATTRKRTPIRIPILANDTLNGPLSNITITRPTSRGTAVLGTDNVLTYSTDTCGFTDTLIYRICNANGCDTALVLIKVSCQTDTTINRLLPIAINDNAQTLINQPITISVLTNDTLNGVLTGRVGIVGRPRFGFALVNANNQIIYTPQNNFCGGRDTLSYEICNANGCDTALVFINVICDSLTATRPPIAVFDVATTPKNTPIRISILANDTLNGTLDSIKIIRSPLLGIASLDINNILTYTPDSCGFTDSLIYRICNRNGCDTAIVFIKVTCDSNNTNVLLPVAVFDTVSVELNQMATIRVILNDTLRGADTFRITKRGVHGAAIFEANRTITYQPETNYCGNDTLIYEICNTRGCDTAIVYIKINCAPLPTLRPVAIDDRVKTVINRQVDFVILGNDTLRGARFGEMVSPPSHGTLLLMPDSVAMYKPDKEFCGRDSFLYRICNNIGCDTALVIIEVSCGDTLEVFRGFSPNGDNKNDRFVIRGIENFPDNEVVIFNRWGNEVFTRKGYRNEEGWDGTWNEKYVPDGTYFYFVRLNDNSNKRITGYVQLVR